MTTKTCRAPKRYTAKRVFLIGTIVIFVFSLFSICSSAFAFHMTFRRRAEPPYTLAMSYTAADEAAYPRVEVDFPSGNNTLRGYLYGTDSQKGIVIVVNGFHATQNGHLGEVFYFVDDGWSVLTFDSTGVGLSDGNSLIGLEQFRRDVLAALDFVSQSPQTKELPIFLYGHSAGGYAVATVCDDPRVSASVCISGFNSALDMMRFFAKKYVGFLADIEYPFLRLYDNFLFGEDGQITAAEQLHSAVYPVWIVQGTQDKIVPLSQSIYAQCDGIENTNITTLLLDDEYRSEHSSIWLATDAASELRQLSAYGDEMTSQYGDDLPEEVRLQLSQNVTRSNLLLRTLDADFMNAVSQFFTQALPVQE